MKKKILCALLASSMLLGITACGTTGAPEETEQERTSSKQDKDEDSEDSEDSEDKAEVITVTAESPAADDTHTEPSPEVEQPKELPVINDYKYVDGCMIFTADGTDYIYNIADNKMYPTELTKIDGREIKSIRGKVVIIADENGYDPEYYNLETGEFIGKVYQTENPYLGEYNAIYTREESFDGVVYSLGVFNSQAEWVVPLSNEYSICKKDLSKCVLFSSDNMYMRFYDEDSYNDGTSHYYDFINDKYIDIPGLPYFSSGNKAIFEGWGNLNVFDITTGTTTAVVSNARFDSFFFTTDGDFLFKATDGLWRIIDSEFNITDIPLSEYDITRFKVVTRDYFAFTAKNSAGTGYVIITDRNGNRVTEPLDGGTSVKISGDYALISGKYVDSWFILNLKTGDQTPIDKENFGGYDEASGMMILKKDGACYLATLDAPNTLINPFEICS